VVYRAFIHGTDTDDLGGEKACLSSVIGLNDAMGQPHAGLAVGKMRSDVNLLHDVGADPYVCP